MSQPAAASPPHPQSEQDGHSALIARSLRRRVAVLVLVLLAVLISVLGLFVDATLGARLRSDLQSRLIDRAQQGQNLFAQVPPQQLVDRISGGGIQAQLATGDGAVYGRVPDLIAPGVSGPPAPPGSAKGRAGTGRAGPAARPGAVSTSGDLSSTTRELPDGSTLTVVADAASITSTLLTLRVITVAGGLVVLLLAALLIGWVVSVALRPLETMTTLARSITAGNRGHRLRPDRQDTDIGRTAAAFDEMLEALEGAEGRARTAEERMREFLADASHELRTPVAGIQAAAETLLRTDPPRADRERLAVTMVRETRRAGRLLADLSDAARLDTGLELRLAPVELEQVAREQTERAQALHPGLSLTWTSPGGRPLRVNGDAGRLGQVLANLLANAEHATAGRGHVSLTLTGHPQESTVVLDVDDDGPGVPAEQRERIFERLVRLDASRQRRTGGAGLGLAISRAIARAHGGDLMCLAAPDGGARFRLTLPAHRPTPHQPSADAALTQQQRSAAAPMPTSSRPQAR